MPKPVIPVYLFNTYLVTVKCKNLFTSTAVMKNKLVYKHGRNMWQEYYVEYVANYY